MFTGIITHLGRVLAVAPGAGGRRLRIAPDFPVADLAIGGSVAHDGICLTVAACGPDFYEVFLAEETLARTTAWQWQPGRRINLERALRLGDELGGHLVFGHVDATGRILALDPVGEGFRLVVGMPESLAPLVAVKGSIAVDGISLTVVEADSDRFSVAIVPHTFRVTTLCDRRPGDAVNLEADMLARYVARQLQFRDLPGSP
ncbi:Riboflavin synthase [bacterium HR40]|nr:Riboflavin synthase [bacterium HR40]